jgi:hypothetical protein
MSIGKLLAIANVLLATGACIGYLAAGDYRRALYWFAAALITASVTF